MNMKEHWDMATAKTLRLWAAQVREWAAEIDDATTAEHADRFATQMEVLATWTEVTDRQLV